MLTTNQKGAIAEAKIAAAALEEGIGVFRPLADERYDLVFDTRPELLRVQCKWARVSNGAVVLRSYSSRRTLGGMVNTIYTEAEIDALAAYCPDLEECYLVPAALVAGRRIIHLRFGPSANNQRERINWAAQYRLGAIAQLGERPAGSREAVGSSPTSSTPEAAAAVASPSRPD